MTREEIEQMPAGLEMNQLVSEHVMGKIWVSTGRQNVLILPNELPTWKRIYDDLTEGRNPDAVRSDIGAGQYSTDIAAAWPLFEKLRLEWPNCDIGNSAPDRALLQVCWGFDGYGWKYVVAESAPLVICRAALIAAL